MTVAPPPPVELTEDEIFTDLRRVPAPGDPLGTHVEPAFDIDWPEYTKLRWKVAVTKLDTDLTDVEFEVFLASPATWNHPLYQVTLNGAILTHGDLHECWISLNAFETGVRHGRQTAPPTPAQLPQLPVLVLSALHPDDVGE